MAPSSLQEQGGGLKSWIQEILAVCDTYQPKINKELEISTSP